MTGSDERVEYTPTTTEVREAYVANAGESGSKYDEYPAEFDRWLAAHDAEVIAGQRGGGLVGIQRYVFDDPDVDPEDEFVRVADIGHLIAQRPGVDVEALALKVLREHQFAGSINSRERWAECICGAKMPVPSGFDSDGFDYGDEVTDALIHHQAAQIAALRPSDVAPMPYIAPVDGAGEKSGIPQRPSENEEQVEERLEACERALGAAREALVCTACKGFGEDDDEGERETCQDCGGSGDRLDQVRREALAFSLADIRRATGRANTGPSAPRQAVSDEWVDEFIADLGIEVCDAD